MKHLFYPFFVLQLGFQLSLTILTLGLSFIPMGIFFLALLFVSFFGSWNYLTTTTPELSLPSPSFIQHHTVSETEASANYYRQLVQLQPTHRDVLLNLSALMATTANPNAEYLYQQALEIDPLLSQD